MHVSFLCIREAFSLLSSYQSDVQPQIADFVSPIGDYVSTYGIDEPFTRVFIALNARVPQNSQQMFSVVF